MSSIREKLSIAHSNGLNRDIILAAGMASPIGILILRWLDNGDRKALGSAKTALSRQMVGKYRFVNSGVLAAVSRVLGHFREQRCKTCMGLAQVQEANGVNMPCPALCAEGVALRFDGWDENHDRASMLIRREIRSVIGELSERMRRYDKIC